MVHLGAAHAADDVGHLHIQTRLRAASTDAVFHPPHPIDQGYASTDALVGTGSVVGAQAAGLDRQTDAAASGAYCLLQPPAGRPLFTRSIYP